MSYLDLLPPMERRDPRVALDVMCNEYVRDRQLIGLIVDASERGLRVQRIPRRLIQPNRQIQIEFELPDGGEPIWALGEICFDRIAPPKTSPMMVRTSGVRIVRAASRHLRMLREFVRDRRDWLALAACFG